MYIWTGRFVTLTDALGQARICKVGFSWVNLFLWWFAPLLRGDWLACVLQFLLAYLTRGLTVFMFPFFYNRLYILGLLRRGWRPASQRDWAILRESRFPVGDWDGPLPREDFSRTESEQSFHSEEDPFPNAPSWQEERDTAVDVEWHDTDS